MKERIIKTIIILIMSICINGCSKTDYQKDESYETDIIGTYEINARTDTDNEFTYYKQYTLYNDNTYSYESNVFGTSSESNGNYTINNDTTSIIRIDFDIKNNLSSNEERAKMNFANQYKKIFKYKNMLGSIIEAKDIPTSETFDYIILDEIGGGMVFTMDGYYHACTDVNNCQCDYSKDTKYIRKDNIIYFNIKDSGNDNYWQIADYIIDDCLFTPELYKAAEE